MSGPFSTDDLQRLSDLVLDAWASGVDLDWSVPAGTLEWSCWTTAEHAIDCVFSYALFLASQKRDGYPNLAELHANPGANAADLVEGLRAVTTMLWAVIVTAPSDSRAVIWQRPEAETGDPVDFAARGGLELILHAHDVCSGLGIAFDHRRTCAGGSGSTRATGRGNPRCRRRQTHGPTCSSDPGERAFLDLSHFARRTME